MNPDEIYKPKIIENFQIDGVATETIPAGKNGAIAQKMFISSLDDGFAKIANGVLSPLLDGNIENSQNNALIIVKPDHRAFVYTQYPFAVRAIIKRSKEKFQLVFEKDIADIVSISFKDDLIDLNPQEGDKFIFLFRENWNFGLFFDFTGNIDTSKTLEELGYYYRKLAYLGHYKFLDDANFFEQMVNDGWFPFVSLLGEGIEVIQTYFQDGKKHPSTIRELVGKFDKARLEDITNKWWSNPLFKNKQKILQAGINNFLLNTDEGYISSVKTLATEIEGVLQMAYISDYGKNPSIKELKKYITERGKERFSTLGSLGFPDRFLDYLNDYIFQSFDIEAGNIPASRHSVAHGVAEDGIYTKRLM